ncbi:MAG TPA: Ig-like domain-containing protein [Terriglobia bacterium]|nr:Ig-like domain-containing protein [Terriglobia bacterium]
MTITSPASGATVGGTVAVSAEVTQLLGALVRGVQFKLDGADMGAEDTTAPYSASWNTIPSNNGIHTLTAVARDAVGLRYTSGPVTVTVFNDKTAPTVAITGPGAGSIVAGIVTVNASASDNIGVTSVQFKLDGLNLGGEDTGAPYSFAWDTTTATNASHSLTAVARDAAGNQATSAAVTVTVFNDTTPPSVSITAPTAGSTVAGTITVSANAADNGVVAGVQFKLDGVNLGAEDTAAPYSVPWNTTTATNASHTLTAVARDAAGNQATSAATVIVFNDTTPPGVSITAPNAGSTVGGTITVSANATDNGTVAGVQFKLDGVNLGAEDTAPPYSVPWNTTPATNASHTLTAVARDAAGNQATSAAVTVTVFNDTTPPGVSITAPTAGSTVAGTITVSANATDNGTVAGVQFKLDGVNLGAEDTAAPYSVPWDTTTATNASHTLTAVARDAAGNQATSAAVTVTVFNDTTPPSVSITAPVAGPPVAGTITVSANATDNGTVAGVQFKLDGVNLGAEDTATPYSVPWDTTTATNASHTLTAVARDAAGNQATSAAVTVTVFNDTAPPGISITAPTAGSTVAGTITVSANATDNGTVAGMQFKLDGVNLGAEDTAAPYSVPWDTTTATNASHALTAVARDAAGNQATSAAVTVTVFNDTTPPTVSITAPNTGSTVGGTITVSANATDNGTVVGVQFKLDGVNLGAEDTAAPYSVAWDTTTATNASHTLTAVARDAAGNQATSAAVTVTVFNDTTPPTVSITAPNTGSTVANTITVSADATDNGTVAGVQFKLDGVNLGAEDTAAPYSVSWDTTTATNASHTLTAVARDAAGNQTTSGMVTVTVSNANPIVVENQQAGSRNWQMWQIPGTRPGDDVGKQIKGYASATSVNKGESITFYVTVTPAQTFTMDVYRIGWYQGLGGRFLQRIGPVSGVQQPACPVDSATGLIECPWTPSYTLTVPTTWTSGIFLAQLTNADGFQNYIIFAVRDDARRSDILYQQAVMTYQAYNNFPNDGVTGKSLYDYNSFGPATSLGTPRAVKVSFNRPYRVDGNGEFQYEYNFVRWLERSGYDVSYSTDLDTHQNGARLLNSKAFVMPGHDEYWSKLMYDHVEQARDAGVHLGFFSANMVLWQVRTEPSPVSGTADRVIVCYKDRALDPVQNATTTITWRDPFIGRPEQPLIGVQYFSHLPDGAPNAPYVVINSSNWVYAGTGMVDGDSVPGIVGYEADLSMSNFPLPASVPGTYSVLSNSPYDDGGRIVFANSSIYQAPSGAWVFGAGTIGWGLGLDYPGIEDARLKRITANLLDRFVGIQPPP